MVRRPGDEIVRRQGQSAGRQRSAQIETRRLKSACGAGVIIAAASLDAHVSVRRSSTMSGDASPRSETAPANQPHAIRAKNRFWRARMRREAGLHENFFLAQNRASTSVQLL